MTFLFSLSLLGFEAPLLTSGGDCLVAYKVLRLSGCLAAWLALKGQVAGFGQEGRKRRKPHGTGLPTSLWANSTRFGHYEMAT